ncbi:MAG: signal recognition particle-docking protein FtsY [Actinobacteria bacterium]|jgi:fused signal recognition particle receptor|nr:signal recognition particle-docking protein FtsY [Actinomycetota bacterium]
MDFLTATPELLIVVAALAAGLIGGLGVARRRKGEDTDAPPRPRTKRDTLELPIEDDPEPGAADGAVLDEAPPTVPDTPESLVEAPTLTPRERFRQRLSRTRNVLGASVADLFGRGVTDEAWDGLEEALITADVGVTATMEIVEDLKRRSREEGATTPEAVVEMLKQELRAALGSADRSLGRATDEGPTVWLVTGVNGTGKTTTIGKLAAIEQREGRSLVLAAADTFRAAAADQLGIWAQRTGAHLVRKDEGADPASVAFESYTAAAERDADLLIVDTAGRLHNKRELMDELGKVKRVLEKQAGPLEETLLVLDATTGQNGISQARAFLEAVEVTGIALTKLDGSSKGGIVVAVQRELGLPVKLVGLGEEIDDLAPFDPDLFVDGLFAQL